jgi:hypothetical protein
VTERVLRQLPDRTHQRRSKAPSKKLAGGRPLSILVRPRIQHSCCALSNSAHSATKIPPHGTAQEHVPPKNVVIGVSGHTREFRLPPAKRPRTHECPLRCRPRSFVLALYRARQNDGCKARRCARLAPRRRSHAAPIGTRVVVTNQRTVGLPVPSSARTSVRSWPRAWHCMRARKAIWPRRERRSAP